MFKLNMTVNVDGQNHKQIQRYSFSKTNVESLILALESNAKIMNGAEMPEFEEFFDIFNKAIDAHCKLEKPKLTKRNINNNPWITDSIVDAISVKEELYNEWIQSKKSKAFGPTGNLALHLKFKNYRKCLKHIIKTQKNNILMKR